MSDIIELNLAIRRFDPDSGRSWLQKYQLRVSPILRLVDVLRKINSEQDPTLAWSSSCEHGQCGSCSVKINGKPLLACELLAGNAVSMFGSNSLLIEPITAAPVERDLVVNLEQAYRKVEKVKPFIIDPSAGKRQGQEYRVVSRDMDPYVEATRCINCFCCSTACISSHESFLGPNAIMASVIRLMDRRERARQERLQMLYSDAGVYRCHSSHACSHVCPKGIDVAHYVALAKAGRFGTEDHSLQDVSEKPEDSIE